MVIEAIPQCALEAQLTATGIEGALHALLRTTPGLAALSASLMFDDGHIERFTVSRPTQAHLTLIK